MDKKDFFATFGVALFSVGIPFMTDHPIWSQQFNIGLSMAAFGTVVIIPFLLKKMRPTKKEKYQIVKTWFEKTILECQCLKKDSKITFPMTDEFYRRVIKNIDCYFLPEHSFAFLGQFMYSPKDAIKEYGDLKPTLDHYERFLGYWLEQLDSDWLRDEFKYAEFNKKPIGRNL